MFPISDDNPTLRTPVMTGAILLVTWAAWLFVQGAGDMVALATSICNLGLVPGELTHLAPLGQGVPLGRGMACVVDNDAINLATPVISMFLHGSWTHIIGNSLYLWVFGNNVEDSMGRGRFLAFYLLTGVIAGLAQVAINPASPVPTVGASGAISGVMGAYLVLYPRNRVRTYIPPIFFIRFPAWAILVIWFGSQLISALPELSTLRRDVSGGVAVFAHIGGFIAGAVLVRWFKNQRLIGQRTVNDQTQVVWS
jgi:membrane associated rhomboid family serine protease